MSIDMFWELHNTRLDISDLKTLYHDSLMQPLCVSATHIHLQQCKLEFDEQMLACTVAEISVAQALLMKAFFKRKKYL